MFIVFIVAVEALEEEGGAVVVEHHVDVHGHAVHFDVDLLGKKWGQQESYDS